MKCVIVNYGSGNLRSAYRALSYVSENHEVILSADPKEIAAADHLILPGVGAFGNCKQALEAREGVIEAMNTHVHDHQRPFLGICVGMQLLADRGEEHEVFEGLSWIGGHIRAFTDTANLVIPQMGWNRLYSCRENPLMKNITADSMVYFVHGFVFDAHDRQHVWAEADYGERYTAIVGKDNIVGTQFHPEKSQRVGLMILKNFLDWRP